MSTVEENTLARNDTTADQGGNSTTGGGNTNVGGARSSGKISNAAGSAAAKARDARSYAQEKLAGARDAATSGYNSAVERGSELAQTARVKAGEVRHQVEEQVQTAPLSVVVGGIALGAVLGLVLPRTRREAELLGDAGRRLTGAAKDAVQAAKEQGKERLDQLGATGEVALKAAKLVGGKASDLASAVVGSSSTLTDTGRGKSNSATGGRGKSGKKAGV